MASGGLYSFLRSPRQASYTFSLDGTMAPRPKNLFYVSFTKSGAVSPWQQTLGFLVKTVGRPGGQPNIEELNQYNKRRQIHTGYKLSPLRISFYDTVDNQAVQMWDEYAKQFFGDYRHENNYGDFLSDIVSNEWVDNANAGFGFAPYAASNSDINAQFYLSTVSVFQVYGGTYVQYDLINPKISSFELDEQSYEDSNIGVINAQLVYEAVIHVNNGEPQSIASNSLLSSAFGTYSMDGDVIELPDTNGAQNLQFSPLANTSSTTVQNYQPYAYSTTADIITPTADGSSTTGATTYGSGVLSSYGSYNFGSLTNSQDSTLASLAAQNPQLASALNIITSHTNSNASNALADPYTTQSGLSQAVIDAANALIAHAGGANVGSFQQNLAAALVAAAQAEGVSITSLISGKGGLSLAPSVAATINAANSASQQFGNNDSETNTGASALVSGSSSYPMSIYSKNYTRLYGSPSYTSPFYNGASTGGSTVINRDNNDEY